MTSNHRNIYNLSDKYLNAAVYQKQCELLKDDDKYKDPKLLKSLIDEARDFFAKETFENRQFLLKHKYLVMMKESDADELKKLYEQLKTEYLSLVKDSKNSNLFEEFDEMVRSQAKDKALDKLSVEQQIALYKAAQKKVSNEYFDKHKDELLAEPPKNNP
ncbi:hypothetical protein TVAG_324200 [Trichomonas vaginalis G3]|uniref:Uncharacterized protein n=1 Tax=Trichomonas vaginalis (strain ATCC PRA-98 / G3) TaxID=412133 RepID=A2FT88_TRIV3|nr:hypothetical protein TVAG_324200 [Trichomonas vaginalis G3]|eukprot:XP_001304802.1 hypothetical protein [Trichomonas vaginalis G3]